MVDAGHAQTRVERTGKREDRMVTVLEGMQLALYQVGGELGCLCHPGEWLGRSTSQPRHSPRQCLVKAPCLGPIKVLKPCLPLPKHLDDQPNAS